MKVDFFDIKSNIKYKKSLIDSLSTNLIDKNKEGVTNLLEYVINNTDTFNKKELKGCLYDGEDETLDLILPAVIRVFNKIFIKPPPLFQGNYDEGIRLELFQLLFDIDEFNIYLVDMLINSKETLKYFDKIDRTAETLSLIVDNYIAGLIEKVLECYDVKSEILRLKKRNDRDIKIKSITSD